MGQEHPAFNGKPCSDGLAAAACGAAVKQGQVFGLFGRERTGSEGCTADVHAQTAGAEG